MLPVFKTEGTAFLISLRPPPCLSQFYTPSRYDILKFRHRRRKGVHSLPLPSYPHWTSLVCHRVRSSAYPTPLLPPPLSCLTPPEPPPFRIRSHPAPLLSRFQAPPSTLPLSYASTPYTSSSPASPHPLPLSVSTTLPQSIPSSAPPTVGLFPLLPPPPLPHLALPLQRVFIPSSPC